MSMQRVLGTILSLLMPAIMVIACASAQATSAPDILPSQAPSPTPTFTPTPRPVVELMETNQSLIPGPELEPYSTPVPTPFIDRGKHPLAEQCETDLCLTLTETYGFVGIYGYYSDRRLEKLQEALEAYALMLGGGNMTRGQALFQERVSGETGFLRIEFVEELQSGRTRPPYTRFAPEAPPELGGQEPDVFALWCGADQMLGPCQRYVIPHGTILVDVTTAEHVEELARTIAHELTHALDSKSNYEARANFLSSGAAEAMPELGNSLQEHYAEAVAQWMFPRAGNPAVDWGEPAVRFMQNYMGPNQQAQ